MSSILKNIVKFLTVVSFVTVAPCLEQADCPKSYFLKLKTVVDHYPSSDDTCKDIVLKFAESSQDSRIPVLLLYAVCHDALFCKEYVEKIKSKFMSMESVQDLKSKLSDHKTVSRLQHKKNVITFDYANLSDEYFEFMGSILGSVCHYLVVSPKKFVANIKDYLETIDEILQDRDSADLNLYRMECKSDPNVTEYSLNTIFGYVYTICRKAVNLDPLSKGATDFILKDLKSNDLFFKELAYQVAVFFKAYNSSPVFVDAFLENCTQPDDKVWGDVFDISNFCADVNSMIVTWLNDVADCNCLNVCRACTNCVTCEFCTPCDKSSGCFTCKKCVTCDQCEICEHCTYKSDESVDLLVFLKKNGKGFWLPFKVSCVSHITSEQFASVLDNNKDVVAIRVAQNAGNVWFNASNRQIVEDIVLYTTDYLMNSQLYTYISKNMLNRQEFLTTLKTCANKGFPGIVETLARDLSMNNQVGQKIIQDKLLNALRNKIFGTIVPFDQVLKSVEFCDAFFMYLYGSELDLSFTKKEYLNISNILHKHRDNENVLAKLAFDKITQKVIVGFTGVFIGSLMDVFENSPHSVFDKTVLNRVKHTAIKQQELDTRKLNMLRLASVSSKDESKALTPVVATLLVNALCLQ